MSLKPFQPSDIVITITHMYLHFEFGVRFKHSIASLYLYWTIRAVYVVCSVGASLGIVVYERWRI